MHALPNFIVDLALMTTYGAFTTIIFKMLKQPVVLGYLLAGLLASPATSFLPSVENPEHLHLWSEIGVIFLLFSLGLEFGFQKMKSVGKPALITALLNMIFMFIFGFLTGLLLKFQTVDCLFLGSMISMSSTTIIIKAFDDLKLKNQKWTHLVFGVLIVEDLIAIILLVLLPVLSGGAQFEKREMIALILKFLIFLSVCAFLLQIIMPKLIQRLLTFLDDEVLLLFSVAFCLVMTCFAVVLGFSVALGSFAAGSVLAEKELTSRIEHISKPLKNLFGSIFFISVGMMVDLSVIFSEIQTVILISLVVIVGKFACSMTGFLISKQKLHDSLMGSSALTQVGEFAFIIASLGIRLQILNELIYPVIVCVSLITTMTTPMFIKISNKILKKHMKKIKNNIKGEKL